MVRQTGIFSQVVSLEKNSDFQRYNKIWCRKICITLIYEELGSKEASELFDTLKFTPNQIAEGQKASQIIGEINKS